MAAPASAADTYVAQTGGSDANAGIGCPQASPCQTIAVGITTASASDTVHVVDPAAPTTYAESLVLANDKSLVAESTDPAETIIDNAAAASPALTMNSTGQVRGFTIASDFAPLVLTANGRVTGNRFNETTFPTQTGADVQITSTAPASTVNENTFTDTQNDTQSGVDVLTSGSPIVVDNTFSGLNVGVDVNPGGALQATPVISRNEITGTHQDIGGAGFAINLDNRANATVADNFIHDPELAATTFGIALTGNAATAGVSGGTLLRNRVFDHTANIVVTDTDAPVTLDSNLIVGGSFALRAVDNGADGGGDVSATNLTAYDSGSIQLQDTALTLDSSVVEGNISSIGVPSCSITFSRGPTTTPGGTGCADFQTIADPMFVSPGTGDYRLQAGSTLIDAGNPAAPGPGATDLDDNAREVDGNNDFLARRDMGAYEFPDLVAPATTISSGPTGTTDDPTPSFAFASPDPSATFTCAVDGAAFSACSGPGAVHTTASLADGQHSFEVRSTDAAATPNVGTPASRSFTVDTSAPPAADSDPPETVITKAPKRKSHKRKAKLKFASSEQGSTFECALDKKPFTACSSPFKKKVKPRKHRFQVRATDAAGNVDPTPAAAKFKVLP